MDWNGVFEVLMLIFIISGIFRVFKILGIIKKTFHILRESSDQLPEINIDVDSTLGM